ncbi:Bordetella uptake gene [uncultured Caudovirales phage]|uniref:Bordetella uptake protein n=1 Tax=uncultured Caudovirales phage TaxID=2100421 RepID=A0A6J5LCA0_9CAUD|nr:Bordetella uptake gene [uncultured Caudovirales phage]
MFKKLLAILFFIPVVALAWEPTKPITVLIGNQPGSGNEVGFRAISTIVMRDNPKANFIIELKPGADSVIAMNMLYEAKPDGYTIAIPSYMSTFVTNDIWQKNQKKFRYDSFTNVVGMGKSPLCIVANPTSKINTVPELIDYVQHTTKPVTVAVGGGAHRMTFEYFMYKAHGNKDLVKTSYFPGPLQAVTATASDAGFEFGIMPVAIARPLIDAGKVKLIGVTGERKVAHYPKVDPIVVNGSHIDVFAAWALILPPGTPSDIVAWYIRNFVPALESAEIKKYYDDNLIFLDKRELSPAGLAHGIEKLRATWIPLSQRVDLTKE